MKLGLISDVHGQLDALERAISILVSIPVDRILCAGDLVDKGSDPDIVVQTLNESLIPSVRGNHDADAVDRAEEKDHNALTGKTIALLKQLPERRCYVFGHVSLWLTHAMPGCLNKSFNPENIPKALKKALRYQAPNFLVLGHNHRPYCVRYQTTWLLNPGSVCRGQTRDSFTCAVLDFTHSTYVVYALEDGSIQAIHDLHRTT